MTSIWEVVGGAGRGGVQVCTDEGSVEGKLSTGSVVKELDRKNGRLQYELLKGSGPASGWVANSKLAKLHAAGSEENELLAACGNRSDPEAYRRLKEKSFLAGEPNHEEMEALRRYQRKFGEAHEEGARKGFNRNSFPWFTPQGRSVKANPELTHAAAMAVKNDGEKTDSKTKPTDIDDDGEEIRICAHCSLPVGEIAYPSKEGKDACVHAECRAQIVLQELREKEEKSVRERQDQKLVSRFQHNIGWGPESIPQNAPIAQRLGHEMLPHGLCCLVYDAASQSVRIAATHEPSASINLEYLLLALKVRRHACREPLFSLDPVNHLDIEKTPQKKVFEPKWLEGTSVGDVMFQADYFLKELALGEYDMPVVGMLSVFDWSELLDKDNHKWSGREWFVVKKAEVRMAGDKTLIPHVKMGVEAREQIVTDNRLEDKPVTSPHHPLRKFADAFTRNYDLIAERKSVIYHLRELAKASVIAKFLIDSGAQVEKSWYALADEIVKSTKPEAYPEIPQLWNMRGNSRIQLKGGRIVDMATGGTCSMQAIYGGVQFGLDKFELAQRAALQGSQLAPGLSPGLQGMQPMGSRQPMFMPQRFQLGQRGETPQGVDLNLDKFSLDAPDRMNNSIPSCSASLDSLEGRVTLGRAFLQGLQAGLHPGLKDEFQQLLKQIFNPAMCDRIEEGAAFVPPDPDLEYIGKVRNLVNDENMILTRRKAHFLDKSFVVDKPGSDFPSSWTSHFQIEKEGRTQTSGAADQHGLVKIEVDLAFQKLLLSDVLPSAGPEFNKSCEDGVIFRIYRIGSLEIRTTQERDCEEVVGAVFSRRAPSWQLSSGKRAKAVGEKEAILKAKVYVEAVEASNSQSASAQLYGDPNKPIGHFYVVLETAASNVIVTERLANGSISWAVNSDSLDDRNSLARLLFTIDCADTTVQAIKNLQAKHSLPMPASAAPAASKAYAKAISQLANGRGFRGKWGGYQRRWTGKSSLTAPLSSASRRSPDGLASVFSTESTWRSTTDNAEIKIFG
eukprot:TRINITY_DN4638_c0_g1_i4.p1 TRINITY_DN4638_c0_g1~~TRINITY_DN4638_c0_g1_i4.p1  ORF type:complete len:1016 (-),score=215.54 TRINITY_DN4638_c0_g1_i4:82-3129(-)